MLNYQRVTGYLMNPQLAPSETTESDQPTLAAVVKTTSKM